MTEAEKKAVEADCNDFEKLDRIASAIAAPTGGGKWDRFGVRTSRKCLRPDGSLADLNEVVDESLPEEANVIYSGWGDEARREAHALSDRENGRIRARAAIRALSAPPSQDALATARAEGRREGLEEAAKVCDEAVCQHEHDACRDDGLILPEWLRTKAEEARQLAKSIRALNAKEPTG